ncbi:outer membrane beta-barrel protein [Polaribacter glomeratus]|uniref:Uncharacterized protein n=1 Tax=Polaribacter glomeratus TaxID=102 RepID=A0A2S7WUJ2_9FLAO|nr:outer membrane beta-barrel protein [Polaribacter glomeratus]PQJ81270.1 hypothetical protein BTO16_01135 [Polaribacter glomeratus]TXD65824.1 porin family protein [Polaribacter glomeratus]
MKKFILVITLALVSMVSFGQNPLGVGSNQFNVGVGLSDWGVPIYVGLDHGISKDLTLGGEISYRSYNERYDNNKYDHSIMGFSGNLNYHFNSALNMSKEWDFYAGPNLGFYVWNSPDGYNGNRKSGLGLGAQLGFRYYLSNKVGLNLEFGGGNAFSGGKFGLTFKL